MKTVITYGSFDLLHYGHLELLRRAHELSEGGTLIVGLSSDGFNVSKGKVTHMPYAKREEMLQAIRYVDKVIPENSWNQKTADIQNNSVDTFVMGDDWQGHFDELSSICEVVYLPRTPDISSSAIKSILSNQTEEKSH